MTAYSRRIWSLTSSPLGAPIAGSGDSGEWPSGPPFTDPMQLNRMTPVDLRTVEDVALMVSVGGITSSPSMAVSLDVFDEWGNLYPAVLTTGAITAAGTKIAAGGLHGGAGSAFLVLPDWGRVSWTCTGGTATGVAITLRAR
jgi:hypothetical protein